MDLVSVHPVFNLYNRSWPILTSVPALPPAKFVFQDEGRTGQALDSLVSPGVIVSGGSRAPLGAVAARARPHRRRRRGLGAHARRRRRARGRGAQRDPRQERRGRAGARRSASTPTADRARGFHVTEGGVTVVGKGGQVVAGALGALPADLPLAMIFGHVGRRHAVAGDHEAQLAAVRSSTGCRRERLAGGERASIVLRHGRTVHLAGPRAPGRHAPPGRGRGGVGGVVAGRARGVRALERGRRPRACARRRSRCVLPAGVALSHRSALWLLGLDVLGRRPRRHRAPGPALQARPGLRVHTAALTDDDLVDVDGAAAVSAARAVVDVARAGAAGRGGRGRRRRAAQRAHRRRRGWTPCCRGLRAARRAAGPGGVAPAGRPERVAHGEPAARAARAGRAREVEAQVDLYDAAGHVARADLVVEGVVVEFDGREVHLAGRPSCTSGVGRRGCWRQGSSCGASPPLTSTAGRRRTCARRCCGPHGWLASPAVRLQRGPDTLRPPRRQRHCPTRADTRRAASTRRRASPDRRSRTARSRTIRGRSRGGDCGRRRGRSGRDRVGGRAAGAATARRSRSDARCCPGWRGCRGRPGGPAPSELWPAVAPTAPGSAPPG